MKNRPPTLVLVGRPTAVVTPRCEAVLSDGSTCGRQVLADCRCLGHLWEARRGERLRPPAARVVSKTVLKEELDRLVALRRMPNHHLRRPDVPGVPRNSVSKALSHDSESCFDTLARGVGYEKLDDETYRRVMVA